MNKKIKTLINLWRDPQFIGSFSGPESFRHFLKMERNIDATKDEVQTALMNIPQYVMTLHHRGVSASHIRHYDIQLPHTVGEIDLAFMKTVNEAGVSEEEVKEHSVLFVLTGFILIKAFLPAIKLAILAFKQSCCQPCHANDALIRI